MRLAQRYGIALVALLMVGATVLFFWSENIINYENIKFNSPVELVWWSRDMSWNYDVQRQCGIHTCRITNKRSRRPWARVRFKNQKSRFLFVSHPADMIRIGLRIIII